MESDFEAKFQEALACHQGGQLTLALELYRQALQIQPQHFNALHLSGIIVAELKDFARAAELIGAALAIKPDSASANYNLGIALEGLRDYQPAVASYDKAIALRPAFVEAYNNRGNALRALRRPLEALESYDKALDIKPDFAEAHNNRGNALADLKRYRDALDSYDKALQFKPDFAEAHNNRGDALREMRLPQAALESFAKAIKIDSTYAEPHRNSGIALLDLEQPAAAIAAFDRAIQLNANFPFLRGARLLAKIRICDWMNLDDEIAALVGKIEQGERATLPFPLLALADAPILQHKAAKIWSNELYPAIKTLGTAANRAPSQKIRLGYFSPDFRNHAVAYLIAELIEVHDRQKFEIYGFSFGSRTEDRTRQRLRRAFDHFIDVTDQSDAEVAAQARSVGVDIAIDLAGHTVDSRTGIFALRAAPVQVNYLGYPGTMGAEYIDYMIADPVIIPEASRQYYSEKVVYLPDSYQANDTKRTVGARIFTRQDLGLPPSGFVFCCFNNSYKISPATFDAWMRILRRADSSVLWLFEENPLVAENLRKEAERRGVNAARLVFAGSMPHEDHLARQRVADLFLDTLPYNAHTTASDALWVGLPVLTRIGESFAGRVAASLLTAIGLPELITSTAEDYEALAVKLATTPDYFREIRQRLAPNRLSKPLFNIQKYTGYIEDAFITMYERNSAGLPPDHFRVEAQ